MKNHLSIITLFLTIVSFSTSCRKDPNNENGNNLLASSETLGEKYTIDIQKSVIDWKGSMLIGANAHTGFVYIAKGDLLINKDQIVGGSVLVNMHSIEDDNHQSNNGLIDHLKNPDFFDVEKFPFTTFQFTKSANKQNITGNLTIKNITQPIRFPAKITIKNGIANASGRLVIDRTKWNIRYKSGKFYDLLADETMSDSIAFHISLIAKKSNP